MSYFSISEGKISSGFCIHFYILQIQNLKKIDYKLLILQTKQFHSKFVHLSIHYHESHAFISKYKSTNLGTYNNNIPSPFIYKKREIFSLEGV